MEDCIVYIIFCSFNPTSSDFIDMTWSLGKGKSLEAYIFLNIAQKCTCSLFAFMPPLFLYLYLVLSLKSLFLLFYLYKLCFK